MIFKDYLPQDSLHMLNLEEFGEIINIDDCEIQAVIEVSTNQKSGNRQLNYPALHGDFLELYFRTEDFLKYKSRLMIHGDICHVNGVRYDVEECTDEQGMTHLLLSAYRQNKVQFSREAFERAIADY